MNTLWILGVLEAVGPYLISVLPVWSIYVSNRHVIQVGAAAVGTLVMCGITAAGLYLVRPLIKRDDKAIFLVSAVLLWVFWYEPVRQNALTLFGNFGRHRYMLPLWLAALFPVVLFGLLSRPRLTTLNRFIGAWSVLAMFALWLAPSTTTAQTIGAANTFPQRIEITHASPSKPNIFYIVLDQYSGARELKEVLNFDNGRFIDFLRDKGFHVIPNALTNYAWTELAMSANLNLDYLPAAGNPLTIPAALNFPDLMANNRLVATLKDGGYTFVDMSLATYDVAIPTRDDSWSARLANSQSILLTMGKLTPVSRPIFENLIEGRIRRRKILEKFAQLKTLGSSKPPTFVYAHFMVPHHPYIFDADGSIPDWKGGVLQLRPDRELYLNQLRFVNREVQATIEAILSASPTPPIIVVQGDHGAEPMVNDSVANVRLRMGILNAWLAPAEIQTQLYEGITPINCFRLLLDYVGARLPLLPDKHFYSELSTPRILIAFDRN